MSSSTSPPPRTAFATALDATPAMPVDASDALQPGARLGEFEVLGVLGVGGFGIVYHAFDHALEREVALKEYMPASLAARGAGSQISLRSSSHADTFATGLRSFVNEARLLARFDHPSLVKVYRFWEDNNTAYMVMPLYRGTTLLTARRAMERPPDEAWLRALIDPLLGAVDTLHQQEVFHRDIAPDNIVLLAEGPRAGQPVLLDFGAARRVIGGQTQNLTAILKPAFAPIEQYAELAHLRQGPWTDLYALGAVLYHMLGGRAPVPSVTRAVQDELPSARKLAEVLAQVHPGLNYSNGLLDAIDWSLALHPADRPQHVQALRDVLDGRAAPTRATHRVGEPAGLPAQSGPVAVAQGSGYAPTAVLPDTPTHAAPERGAPPPLPGLPAGDRPRRAWAPWAVVGALVMVSTAALGWWISDRLATVAPDAPLAASVGPAVAEPPPVASAAVAEPLAGPTTEPTTEPTAQPAATAQPSGAAPVPQAAVVAPLPGQDLKVASPREPAPEPVRARADAPALPGETPVRRPDDLSAEERERAAARRAALERRLETRAEARADARAQARAEAMGEAPPDARADPRPERRADPVPERAPPVRPAARAAPAEPVATSPREACGRRVLFALWRCMQEQCETPRYARHAQCVQLREQEERNRSPGGF